MENNKMTIAVIGLGYVGMPLAIAFSEKFETIGYDIDEDKINKYKNYIDPTGDRLVYTSDAADDTHCV
ncbi:hypothetical protein BU114_12255, partial [Staphylococcus shinii]